MQMSLRVLQMIENSKICRSNSLHFIPTLLYRAPLARETKMKLLMLSHQNQRFGLALTEKSETNSKSN